MSLLLATVCSACIVYVTSFGCATVTRETDPPELLSIGRNLVFDFPAINVDGTVNVVVEIPAGTTAKWETLKSGDGIRWERRDGELRRVKYLAYPGNYGMVPGTLLPRSLGGDGDPLDVLILGDRIERGEVVPVRVIGMLRMLDGGEQDDKILAVRPGSDLASATDLETLRTRFPGIAEIVELWFSNYKGTGHMQSRGYVGAEQATQRVHDAAAAFERDRTAKLLPEVEARAGAMLTRDP